MRSTKRCKLQVRAWVESPGGGTCRMEWKNLTGRNVWARYREDHTHVTRSTGPRWWTIIKPAIEALWHQCAQPTQPPSKTHSDSFIAKLTLKSHERLFREGQACLMYGLYKTISSNRRSSALEINPTSRHVFPPQMVCEYWQTTKIYAHFKQGISRDDAAFHDAMQGKYLWKSSFRCFCNSQVFLRHIVQESFKSCLKETLSIQLVPGVPEYSGDMPHLHCKINNSYLHRWGEILKALISMNQQLNLCVSFSRHPSLWITSNIKPLYYNRIRNYAIFIIFHFIGRNFCNKTTRQSRLMLDTPIKISMDIKLNIIFSWHLC